MAVIKSGDSTDQAHVTPAKALLVDGTGTTQTVTGTVSVSNFPATQPISGTVTANAGTGTMLVDGSAHTQPVSGTVAVNNFPATQPVSGTVAVSGVVATTQQGGSSGLIGDTQVKGVPGTTALMTQDFKDSGRTFVVITIDPAAANTHITDTLHTDLIINKGAVQTTAQSSYTVSAGKTLRLQSIVFSLRAGTAAIQFVRIRVRAASAILVTSPVISEVELGTTAAVINVGASNSVSFPDGLEMSAGQQIGISDISNLATNFMTFSLVGYEY